MSHLLPTVALLAALPVFGQSAGVMPEWEIKQSLASLAGQTQRLQPILEQIRPQDWTAQGAPEAYLDQWKSLRAEIQHLRRNTDSLVRQPDRLALTLEVFFRLQAMESMLDSLGQGVRRYQNPALADLLQGVVTETAPGREKLRQYLVDLAAAKEEELRIADQEAQQCRAIRIKQPKPAGRPERQP